MILILFNDSHLLARVLLIYELSQVFQYSHLSILKCCQVRQGLMINLRLSIVLCLRLILTALQGRQCPPLDPTARNNTERNLDRVGCLKRQEGDDQGDVEEYNRCQNVIRNPLQHKVIVVADRMLLLFGYRLGSYNFVGMSNMLMFVHAPNIA
jgi:hypothetical protein